MQEQTERNSSPQEESFTPQNWRGFLKHIHDLLTEGSQYIKGFLDYSGTKIPVSITSEWEWAEPEDVEEDELQESEESFYASKVSGDSGEGIIICCPWAEDILSPMALVYVAQLEKWFFLQWAEYDPQRFFYGSFEDGTFVENKLATKTDGRFLENFLRTLHSKRDLTNEEVEEVGLKKISLTKRSLS